MASDKMVLMLPTDQESGISFNMKLQSYWYGDSRCADKTIFQLYYLHKKQLSLFLRWFQGRNSTNLKSTHFSLYSPHNARTSFSQKIRCEFSE